VTGRMPISGGGGIITVSGSTLKNGLVAAWEFETNTNDSTINAHTLSNINVGASFVSGKVGQALDTTNFIGGGGYLNASTQQ